jgi:uncharacterized protein YigE (DUF2233 family)
MVLAILAVGLARADDVKNKCDKDKNHAQATITKVDAQKRKVTVTWKDQDGKQVDKSFYLAENAEYVDDTGRVATIDVFRSGDEVLIVESKARSQC